MKQNKLYNKSKMLIGICLSIFFLFRFPLLFAGKDASSIPDITKLPQIKWTFNAGSPLFSSPVISDGLVYLGSLNNTFYALRIKDGTVAWKFTTGGSIRSDACIEGNFVYLNGGDGYIYSLDKYSGKQIWSFKTGGEKKYDFADYFHSSPIYSDGVIYFGSGDGNLYKVDAFSGKLVWNFKTEGIIHTTPAIGNGKIYFGSFDGYVYALNQSDGKMVWKFKSVGHRYFPAGEVQGSPAVFNGLVFIGARDYNIYAIDAEKGYCHWNKSFVRGWGLCNNIHDSVLYTGSADERVLIASDPYTGREFWRKNMEFLVFGNNAYSDSLLYIGTTIGKIHAISKLSGEKIWTFETNTYLQNREKYFKPDDSYRDDIYSIIKSNEHFLEVELELGGIFTTPTIFDDCIFFSSTNGLLYCLESNPGE